MPFLAPKVRADMNPREIIERFVVYSPLFIDSGGTDYCNFCGEKFAQAQDIHDLNRHRISCVWATAKRYLYPKETKMDDRDKGFLSDALETEYLFETTLDGLAEIRVRLAKEVGDFLAVSPQTPTLMRKHFELTAYLSLLDEAWKAVKAMEEEKET